MEPFIIKRVRSSEGHQERVVHWVEHARRGWLGAHIDWSAAPTIDLLEEFILWLLRPLIRFNVWVGRFSWWRRFTLAFGLLLPLFLLIAISRERYTDDVIMLQRFARFNAELNTEHERSLSIVRLSSGRSTLPTQQYIGTLGQLAQSNQELLLEWRTKHRWPFANHYNALPHQGENPWDWSHQLQMRLSWQEGLCTTLTNGQLHHIEIIDDGDVGHFSGLISWQENPRIHLQGTQWNKLLALSAQFPTSAEPNIPQNHVLFVSYRSGDDWKVRIYDRRRLPVPLVSLSRLIRADYIE